MINLVLAVTLILSIIPVGVTAQDDVTYVPKWVNNVVGDTTVIVSDDYGSLWVVGTSEGYVYIFDKHGNMIWENPIQPQSNPVIKVIMDSNTIAVHYIDGSVYLVESSTGTTWYTFSDNAYSFGARVYNEIWYILAEHSSDKLASYLFAITPTKGSWFIIDAGISASEFAIVSGNGVSQSSTSKNMLRIIPFTNIPEPATFPPLSQMANTSLLPAPSTQHIPDVWINVTAIGTTTFTPMEMLSHPVSSATADILIVGGGGSGGTIAGSGLDLGGGGAGGLIHLVGVPVEYGLYTAIVGSGAVVSSEPTRGENSSLSGNGFSYTAIGGGSGGGLRAASSGGSGGGATRNTAPGLGTPGQGYNGGGTSADYNGGGGGGSGGPGLGPSAGGMGGPGTTIWNEIYAVGGSSTSGTASPGGSGPFTDGRVNSGNGGGGGGTNTAGKGGSGVIRMHISTVSPPVITTMFKSYTGDITKISSATTSVAIQTANRLYVQDINTDGTFGTVTDMLERVGNGYSLDITADASATIEGRGNTIDIFRSDGTRTGTYDAGGIIHTTNIAHENGLYAVASSSDTKFYLFSKDESSMWYLLFSSPTGNEITSTTLSAYGDMFAIARGSTISVYQTTQREIIEGFITIHVYDNAGPYTNDIVAVQRRDEDGIWGDSETYDIDAFGTAVINAEYGKLIKIVIGQNIYSTTLIPTPAQSDYIIRIPADVPLRTGANYRSWYDSALQRIYYSYFDTRGKTHVAEFEVIRNSDNTVVKTETFTIASGDTSMHTGYYQIPAGFTNTSYRIHLTATGSPSFSNTWHQWISGESGVASLPVELSKTVKIGMFMVLLLFIGGIFSYSSGPHGAIVVSLVAAMLVFWGWLPISPAVVVLCVVWAFLGLLGRTSVG